MHRILILRLGSLGDIVHALPAVAALREAFPEARIDWLVDAPYTEFLRFVPVVDEGIEWCDPRRSGWRTVLGVLRRLRAARYDAAVDLQGLLKSAILARASGAVRVVGFARAHLREPAACAFYREVAYPEDSAHVVDKNLALARVVGATATSRRFPIEAPPSGIVEAARGSAGIGERAFALLNPGAAWPNKRWPPERFGRLAAHLQERHRLASLVVWGPGEQEIAHRVVESSSGAAHLVPETSLGDLVTLTKASELMVSGDTGPLHIAAAVGTPVVAIFGPTDPGRNGPWSSRDVVVSRSDVCVCYHKRRCVGERWCLEDVEVAEVVKAVDQRLARGADTTDDVNTGSIAREIGQRVD